MSEKELTMPSVALRPVPIDEFRDAIVADYRAREVTATRVSQIRRVLRIARDEAGVRSTADLTAAAVDRFREATERLGQSERSRVELLRSFRAVCHAGVRLGILAEVPPFPKIPQPRDFAPSARYGSPPTDEEVRRFLDHLKGQAGTWEGHRLYALATTVACTGLRREEALGLLVEDVDLVKGTIRVRGREKRKYTSRPSPVRFQAGLGAILAAWIKEAGSPYLFPGKQRNAPWAMGRHKAVAQLKAAGAMVADEGRAAKPEAQLRDESAAAGVPTINFEWLRRYHAANAFVAIDVIAEHATRPESATSEPRPVPCIDMRSPGKTILVRGKRKGPLTEAEYRAIAILRRAWPRSLSLKEMNQAYGSMGWRKTLIRLREKDPEWSTVVRFPGKNGAEGFGILPW